MDNQARIVANIGLTRKEYEDLIYAMLRALDVLEDKQDARLESIKKLYEKL